MSAASPLPPPPPGPPPNNAMNGYGYSAPSGGPEGWGGSDGASNDGRGTGDSLPHMSDIVTAASARVEELRHSPIGKLLENAQSAFNSATMLVQSRRANAQAKAYLEYLVASQILLDTIQRHPDFYDRVETSRGATHRQYKQLMKEVNSYGERFMSIKNIINNDNKRTGVRPNTHVSSRPPSRGSQYSASPARISLSQESRYSYPNGSTTRHQDDELMLPPARSSLEAPAGQSAERASSLNMSGSPRRKPPVHPKPQTLHGKAISNGAPANGSNMGDELAERFAKLRGAPSAIDTGARSSTGDLSVKMPSPTEFQPSSRPSGPRDMPAAAAPAHAPPHPPKLPLNTQYAASMPKEPSPTYSPARNLSTPASINPPRSTARSIVGTGGRSNSLAASSVSAYPPNSNGETDSYFPTPTNGDKGTASVRRKSVHMPREFQISAEKLYDYTRFYNVLLIDVRNREEFDAGHIYVKSIMCIEPTALQDGYSADQLQDALVLSPDEEQVMFERRDQYELVVYYDDSTQNTAFLTKTNRSERDIALKRLFDSLYEFNADKPLQRPPILLMGGIEAWTNLLGTTSLKTSTTAALVAAGHTKPSRAIKRVPVASNAARLNLHKRRIREYAPMDAEEERKWLEQAQRDRPTLEQSIAEDDIQDDSSPIFRTTEDFLRRYPEVDLEQQSMMYPPSRPPPPAPNNYVAPTIPTVPSRPPPSVPRVSYSGVHERQIAPHGRVSQLPAYVSPSHHTQFRLPRTGLINFGVTCYMNSTIQCLNATVPLTAIFLSNNYLKGIQRENWKGTRGLMSEHYAVLLQNLWKNDVTSLRPTSFRRLCARFNSEWGIERQQDAKEFLEFLLDLLHEDLNPVWAKPPLRELSTADEEARERLPRPYAAKIEWTRYIHREKSIIGDLFAGQHASQLTCRTCGTTSTTYEAFWSLSVEIPHDRPGDLRDCLRSYCAPERLSGDDIWRCPRCKVDREATKQITITRAPDYLVMHFKRFSASHTERARKVRTPIEFPLHGLDLGPYMLPPMAQQDEDFVLANAREGAATLEKLKADHAMNGPYIYNAYAVMRHIGTTLSGGHYIAMVKDKSRGCWRQFNDERVTDFEPGNLPRNERLQNELAYIVFYERESVAGGAL